MIRKITPLCYLTLIGFAIAALLFAARREKLAVDLFQLRQSFGLYLTSFCFYLLYKALGSDLLYTDLRSRFVFIPFIILWFLGFRAAMEGKQTPLPIVGRLYQKWFHFVAKPADELQFASTTKINELEAIAVDFFPRVLGYDFLGLFVSDESSVFDFGVDEEKTLNASTTSTDSNSRPSATEISSTS